MEYYSFENMPCYNVEGKRALENGNRDETIRSFKLVIDNYELADEVE